MPIHIGRYPQQSLLSLSLIRAAKSSNQKSRMWEKEFSKCGFKKNTKDSLGRRRLRILRKIRGMSL